MEIRKNYYLFLILIIFLCVVGLLFENFYGISGLMVTKTTSNVTFQKFFSISLSENLSEGINFGYIGFLPANDVNASHNYNGVFNGTTMYINISPHSSIDVDFCIRANDDLINPGGDRIGLGNQTYSHFSSTNFTYPSPNLKNSLNTNFVSSGTGFSPGSANYFRFWLDVPSGISTGSYNNTVHIKGMESGGIC